jgi:two-component system, sensor histidine kinase LadS
LFKIIFFVLLWYTSAHATLCIISDHHEMSPCPKAITYMVDTDKTYSNDFLPPHERFTLNDKLFLGHVTAPVWTKLEVKYTGNETKRVIFYNPKVLTDHLDVFIYRDGALIQRETLGDMVEPTEKAISSRYSAFELALEPHQTYTIITHIRHKGAFDIRWNITDGFDFYTFTTHESIAIGVFVGLLIAILFYSLLIYKATRFNIYLFYSAHIFLMFLYQIANTNILYQYDVMLGGYFIWVVAFLSFAALLLFGMTYVRTKATYPRLHTYLKLMVFVFLFMAFYFFLASYFNELMRLRKFFVWSGIVFILLFIAILSYIAIVKKIQGRFYYVIGHAGYIACITYPHVENIIARHFQLSSFYVSIGGILFDVLFLSIALNKNIAHLRSVNTRQNELLIAQSSFSTIGKTLAGISHQYKTPLAHLSILATSLEAYLFKTENKEPLLKDITANLRKSISFMDETMKNFNDFYAPSATKERFLIADEIRYLRHMLKERAEHLGIVFETSLDPDLTYKGYKNAFDNVLMIVIENAIEIFERRSTQNPTLTIKVTRDRNTFTMIIADNAGGIEASPVESVFDMFASTKDKSSGLGLAMCKILVETRLEGSIKGYNTDKGACFEIVFQND